ncbi:MAG: hypothetical protein HOP30_07235 [Cyclobacteriaceae bacterium]|nr:hypothetical protein [Cyclobacteriaceae bacterium]
MSRSTSTTTSLATIILLVITFPIWFSVGAGLFGAAVGIIGALFGVLVAIIGICIAVIAVPFKLLFGWGDDWGWHSDIDLPFFHTNNGFLVLILVAVMIVLIQKRKSPARR